MGELRAARALLVVGGDSLHVKFGCAVRIAEADVLRKFHLKTRREGEVSNF